MRNMWLSRCLAISCRGRPGGVFVMHGRRQPKGVCMQDALEMSQLCFLLPRWMTMTNHDKLPDCLPPQDSRFSGGEWFGGAGGAVAFQDFIQLKIDLSMHCIAWSGREGELIRGWNELPRCRCRIKIIISWTWYPRSNDLPILTCKCK